MLSQSIKLDLTCSSTTQHKCAAEWLYYMNKENLNNILIRHTDWNNVYPKDLSQADHSIVVDEKVRIEAIFKNLEDKVVEKITSVPLTYRQRIVGLG